jgi:hypothetical protein
VLHVIAVLLIVGSVFLYETSTAVAVVAVAVIQFTHTSWRVAIARTSAVVGAVLAALVIPRIPGVLPGRDPHHGLPVSDQVRHARMMADQAFTVLTGSVVPFGAAHRNIVVPILGLILVLALVTWMRAPRGSSARSALGRWLWCVVVGAVVVAAAYAVFTGTDFSYQPVFEGAANRMNVVAAIGYCLIVFGAAMLLAVLITELGGPRPRAALVVASGAALFVASATRTGLASTSATGIVRRHSRNKSSPACRAQGEGQRRERRSSRSAGPARSRQTSPRSLSRGISTPLLSSGGMIRRFTPIRCSAVPRSYAQLPR